MTWQDVMLGTGSISFSLALLPSIVGTDKPAVSTSLLTGGWLAVFSGVYASLSLWFACITSVVTASLWLVLAAQVIRRRGAPTR